MEPKKLRYLELFVAIILLASLLSGCGQQIISNTDLPGTELNQQPTYTLQSSSLKTTTSTPTLPSTIASPSSTVTPSIPTQTPTQENILVNQKGVLAVMGNGFWLLSIPDGQPVELPGYYGGFSSDWSPDGKSLIIDAVNLSIKSYDQSEIFLINPELPQGIKRLTYSSFDQRDPHWSPEGKRIVAFQIQGVRNQIYLLDSEGSYLRFIGEGFDPRWSEDGKRLAYVNECTYQNNSHTDNCLFIADLQSGEKKEIVRKIGGSFPFNNIDWSPDGSMIAYISSDPTPGIWIYHINEDTYELIISGNASITGPEFSPDSRYLAYLEDESGYTLGKNGEWVASENGWIHVIKIIDLQMNKSIAFFAAENNYFMDLSWTNHPIAISYLETIQTWLVRKGRYE